MAQLLMKYKKEHFKKKQGLWFLKGFVGIGEQLPFTKTLVLPAAYIYSVSMKTPNPQNSNSLSGKAIVLWGSLLQRQAR